MPYISILIPVFPTEYEFIEEIAKRIIKENFVMEE